MKDEKGRALPCVAIRDLDQPTAADLETAVLQMAHDARNGLEASNQTRRIRRVILICDDQAAGDSLEAWTASLEPGWNKTRVAKFNN